jgi:uncharacterized membrane protein
VNDLALAYGIGALSGARSMLGPALVAHEGMPGYAERLLAAMATAEMLADKSPRIASRLDPLPLAGRVVAGALAAAGAAHRGRRVSAAVMGAAGALSAAYICYHLRRLATTKLGVPNAVAGLAEDALAIAAAGQIAKYRHAV